MAILIKKTPATATTPEMLETPVTPTTLIIGDKGWELKTTTPADAKEIYTALGTVKSSTNTNYQTLVTALSKILLNYNSPMFLDIPAGQDPKSYITKLKDTYALGVDKLDETQKKVMEQLQGLPVIGDGFKTTKDTLATLGDIANFFGDVAIGAKKGIMLPWNVKDAGKEVLAESGKYLDGKLHPITQEQADTLATVYAAALYKAKDAPDAPVANKPTAPSGVDNVFAWGKSVADHSWGFIRTLWECVSTLISTGHWDWDKATAVVEADRGKAMSTKEYLEKSASAKTEELTRTTAAQTLASIPEVDGVPTENLSKMISKPCMYRDNDGYANLLSFDEKGIPSTAQIKGKDGKPVTAMSQQENSKAITPANAVQFGAEALVVGNGLHGFSRGVMSKMTGEYTTTAKLYDKKMEKVNELRTQAQEARTGAPIKNVLGKVTGHKAPDAKLAKQLEKQANAEYKLIEKDVKPLEDYLAAREAMFGKNATKFAESESLLSKFSPKWGKIDFVNRGAAIAGKGVGLAGDKVLGALEKGEIHSSKLAYAFDAAHGGMDLVTGNTHGLAVDAGHIGGAWVFSKYGTQLTEKALLKYATKMAPGKAKLIVAGAGLLTFLGGRALGGAAANVVSPGDAPAAAAAAPGADQLDPKLVADIQAKQKEFTGIYDALQKAGVNPAMITTDEQLSVLRNLPTAPAEQAQLLAQMQQAGIIPATLSQPDQLAALKLLQKMTLLQDNVLATLKNPQASVGDTVKDIAFNTVTSGAGLSLSKLVCGTTALAGGEASAVTNAAGDVIDGANAVADGDTRQAIRSGTKIATGVAGSLVTYGAFSAILAGAGTGLAAGAITGPGAIVTMIGGGLAAAIGYYCYSNTGDQLANIAINKYDQIKQKDLQKTAFASKNPVTPQQPSVTQPDTGLAAATIDSTNSWNKAADTAKNAGRSMLVSRVQMGATVDSTGVDSTGTVPNLAARDTATRQPLPFN